MPYKDSNTSKSRNAIRIEERRGHYLSGKTCVDCGSGERLQFDHRDPATKLFEVGGNWLRSISSIEAEIAKCDVRCFDCHMKRHGFETTGHGHPWTYYGKGCRCDECRTAVNAARPVGAKRTSKTAPVLCGTRRSYQLGCTCDECRAANNAYARQRKANAYAKYRNANQ